jgi:steroid delta-isomerase-like uncharacterized protein
MNARAIIEKQLEHFNKHDAAAFVAPYTPDATCYDPYYEQPLKGREALRQDAADFFQGFPDIKGRIVGDLLTGGNTAAFEVELTGTHQGILPSPNGPIPPTNRSMRLTIGRFVHFTEDGQITSDNRYYDIMSIMSQLGLMQETA